MRFSFCLGNWSRFIHDHKGDLKKKSFLLKEAICVGHTATLNLDQVSVETQEVCLYLIKLQKGRERNVK